MRRYLKNPTVLIPTIPQIFLDDKTQLKYQIINQNLFAYLIAEGFIFTPSPNETYIAETEGDLTEIETAISEFYI